MLILLSFFFVPIRQFVNKQTQNNKKKENNSGTSASLEKLMFLAMFTISCFVYYFED